MTTPRQNAEMTDRYADPATVSMPTPQQSEPPMSGDPSYPPGEPVRPQAGQADLPRQADVRGHDSDVGYADAPTAGRSGGPSDDNRDTRGLDDGLFGHGDLADLRNRWNDVQAAFVDDPRACVQQADGLVSTAVEQLTANFARTRSQLEDQWQRGEEASTEDLRVALKRYRDFFDRLLSV